VDLLRYLTTLLHTTVCLSVCLSD